MKLSFSTKGWHDQSWEDFFLIAAEQGFSGIELHDVRRFSASVSAPFSPQNAAATVRRMQDAGIGISCVDAGCNIAAETCDENDIDYSIALAVAAHAPYVRLRAGDESDLAAADARVIDRLERAIPKAERAGVILLIESVGIYADTARLAAVLDHFACDALAALWDIHYPCRMAGESPEQTVKNLGAYICHIHLKDSVETENGFEYALPGEGTLPMTEIMQALRSINYDGFISLEWDPAWIEAFASPDIIFPYFAAAMRRFRLPERRSIRKLYSNKSGTGKFIWPKDDLIELTFPEVLDRVVREFPDQYCFRYTTLDYTRTYSEFRDDVDAFAKTLIALGVKSGDHVSVWCTNVPHWYIAFSATTKIGAVLVTVNTAYKIHEAEYLFKQSDTHTLIMVESYRDSNYAAIMQELCPELATHEGGPLHCKRLPFLRNIITVGFRMPGCLTWEESLQKGERVPIQEVRRRVAAVQPDDVCNMQYTSGTTGFPKGVMLTHYNVVNNGKYIGDHMDLSTADRMMIQVPMFHCFGMVLSMTASMTHGTTMSPMPYFTPKPSLACENSEKITCFNGVPTMFIAMMQHEDFAKTDFSHMRIGIMAGSNCPADLMKLAATGPLNMKEIVSVYGQTEASPGCTMSSWYDSLEVRTETVGSAFANVECKVIDPDTGEECPDGVNGEFGARGYNIMKGYYKMPAATAAAIDADGWLHTGDLACRRPDGNYLITGRLKDMIIRGGENLYPKEIEEFFYTHDKVRDVQVVGVPDERYGEEALACIILKEGVEATIDELREYAVAHMARHKVPRYIEFVTEFPMNAAGKIQKFKMREAAIERLGLKK